jgi:small-conductance mechanosensitive channel
MWPIIQNWTVTIWVIGLPLLVGILGHIVGYRLIRKITAWTKFFLFNALIRLCFRPVLWLVILLSIRTGLVISLGEETFQDFNHILALLIIACWAWLLIKLVFVLEDFVTKKYQVNSRDNLKARKIHTQLSVLKRMIVIIICILAVALMLMTFPGIRQVGTTILASAGIISIVVGLSAQKTIGTFIAGLQIAFTQPIRMDDVVIVEGEWGKIEEIALTYVVVKIWDQRRLVVPITYFIDKPFQNWTRTTAEITGSVYIYTDYTIPVEALRTELGHILEQSPLWDKKVGALQVTDAKEHTIELRAIISAADASDAWSLRCLVREKLIDFIRTNYPQSLPRFRTQLDVPVNAPNSRKTTKNKKQNDESNVI